MLQDAWADVEASTIRNCWRKGCLVISPEEEPTAFDPPAEISTEEFEQWIATDDSVPVSEPVTDEDIGAEVREHFGVGTDAVGSEEGEEKEEEESRAIPGCDEKCNLHFKDWSAACGFQQL